MGQTVSSIKAAAVKQNQEAEKTANDALTALQDIAKLQVQLFKLAVRDDKDPNKINIKKILSDESMIRCTVVMEGDKLAGEIESTYNKFASGDIAKGIGSVLSIGLKALFGNASGNSNSTQKSFVTVGKLGYPLRVDIFLYYYSFTSETLIKVTKDVLATSIVVSSVDIVSLDESTIGALVTYCYGDAEADIQQGILDKLVAVREKIISKKQPETLSMDELSSEEQEIRNAWQEIVEREELSL